MAGKRKGLLFRGKSGTIADNTGQRANRAAGDCSPSETRGHGVMAAAVVLGATGAIRAGSSPVARTRKWQLSLRADDCLFHSVFCGWYVVWSGNGNYLKAAQKGENE